MSSVFLVPGIEGGTLGGRTGYLGPVRISGRDRPTFRKDIPREKTSATETLPGRRVVAPGAHDGAPASPVPRWDALADYLNRRGADIAGLGWQKG
jgi:hypothetical protein